MMQAPPGKAVVLRSGFITGLCLGLSLATPRVPPAAASGRDPTSLTSRTGTAMSGGKVAFATGSRLSATVSVQAASAQVTDKARSSLTEFGDATDHAAEQSSFYVSPTGRDTNPGTLAKPFLTFQKARDAASALISRGMTGDITIRLRNGMHWLGSTLVLGPRSSGQNGFHVIYDSYEGSVR